MILSAQNCAYNSVTMWYNISEAGGTASLIRLARYNKASKMRSIINKTKPEPICIKVSFNHDGKGFRLLCFLPLIGHHLLSEGYFLLSFRTAILRVLCDN